MENTRSISGKKIHQVAEKGDRIYQSIKGEYLPAKQGEFLAIEPDSEKIFFGVTGHEAVRHAKEEYPKSTFYVVKIGFSAKEMLTKLTGSNGSRHHS